MVHRQPPICCILGVILPSHRTYTAVAAPFAMNAGRSASSKPYNVTSFNSSTTASPPRVSPPFLASLPSCDDFILLPTSLYRATIQPSLHLHTAAHRQLSPTSWLQAADPPCRPSPPTLPHFHHEPSCYKDREPPHLLFCLQHRRPPNTS